MATAAEVIGAFVALSSHDHSADVLTTARRAFADTLGCIYLGADHPNTLSVLETVRGWGHGPAQIIGHDVRLAPPWAALVNGTAAHALDFDDWEDPGITHPSAAIFPAILAIASKDMDLGALLDAWIVGVEVIMRIGEAVNMTHYEIGWHTTNTLGAIGATAACARLTRLNAEQAQHAISLSTSMLGGFTSQFGTTTKPLHAGLAAKSGVMAATLATNKATAQSGVFEHPAGFLSTMTRAEPDKLASALSKLGQASAISQYGLHTKKYPSCGCTHLIIEACEVIKRTHDLDPGQIARVDTQISDIAYSVLPYGVPADRTEALFSVPWCAAVALENGTVRIADFDAATLAREDLRALAARVAVSQHARAPGLAFHPSFPDTLTVHLKDGTRLSHSVAYPIGSPTRPLSDDMLQQKFMDCVAGRMPALHAQSLYEKIIQNSRAISVSDLLH